MSLPDLLSSADGLLQHTKNSASASKNTWTSVTGTAATTKVDLSKMLDLADDSLPYNTGVDLSGTSVKKDELSPITESTTSRDSVITADNIDVANKIESTDGGYNILYYPEALLAGGSLGKRYPHAMGIFLNVNSKSKLGVFMEKYGQVATKRLDGSDLQLGDNTNGSAVSSGAGTFLAEAGVAAKFKRFTGCILLPLPLDINATYSAQYNTTGASGVIGSALKAGSNGANTVAELTNLASGVATGAIRDFTKNILVTLANNTKTGTFGEIDNPGGMFDKVLGTIRNPRTEQVFEKIDLRTFNFSWQINITTVKEWNTIRKIISLLKENMHPELDIQDYGTFMVMPNEFDIEFFEKVSDTYSESKSIPKIATSALSSLEVNYTPQGNWIAFEGTMIPPFVMIRAVFKEMEPLHRGMVRDVSTTDTNFSAYDAEFEDKRRGF